MSWFIFGRSLLECSMYVINSFSAHVFEYVCVFSRMRGEGETKRGYTQNLKDSGLLDYDPLTETNKGKR